MANVLVFAQTDGAVLTDGALQCLARGRELAAATGGTVDAVLVGDGVTALAASLGTRGVARVHVADAPAFGHYLTTPYKRALQAAVAAGDYGIVLLPATTSGDDLAPALAAGAKAACVVDCAEVRAEGGSVQFWRREFDRKVLTAYAAAGSAPVYATLLDGAAAGEPAGDAAAQVLPLAVAVDTLAAVLKRDVAARRVNLQGARVIVAAGAGVGSQANFAAIRDLAEALGAEIGATRAVVDAGWLPADHQIGQTGATVRPELYIACGISGAVQHRVGMLESRTIVAINTDRNAPIFKIAHYRIVGDLNEVVPRLARLVRQ